MNSPSILNIIKKLNGLSINPNQNNQFYLLLWKCLVSFVYFFCLFVFFFFIEMKNFDRHNRTVWHYETLKLKNREKCVFSEKGRMKDKNRKTKSSRFVKKSSHIVAWQRFQEYAVQKHLFRLLIEQINHSFAGCVFLCECAAHACVVCWLIYRDSSDCSIALCRLCVFVWHTKSCY